MTTPEHPNGTTDPNWAAAQPTVHAVGPTPASFAGAPPPQPPKGSRLVPALIAVAIVAIGVAGLAVGLLLTGGKADRANERDDVVEVTLPLAPQTTASTMVDETTTVPTTTQPENTTTVRSQRDEAEDDDAPPVTDLGCGSDDATAGQVMAGWRAADSDRLSDLAGSWVAQVSGKYPGVIPKELGATEPWSMIDVCLDHLGYRSNGSYQAILANTQDYATTSDRLIWLTVIGEPFATAEGALAKCRDLGFYDKTFCFARRLVNDPGADSVEYP